MKRCLVVVLLCVAVVTSGCGSIAEPAKDGGKAAVEPQGKAPSNKELRKYFEYLATYDPAEMRKAVKLAAPKSNAAAYAIYMTASSQADLDAGITFDPGTVKSVDKGFALCDEEESGDKCNEFTKITYSRGKIADFNAGGRPLAKRITLGNGETKKLGPIADTKMIAAYNSIAGDLVVVFEIKALQDKFWISGATLVTPEGRQSENTEKTGPEKLQEGALANYSVVFKGADIGGKVTLSGYSDADQSYTEHSVDFETR
jgi:hypothetical protein